MRIVDPSVPFSRFLTVPPASDGSDGSAVRAVAPGS
jgi:hypothetical protein